MALSKDPQKMSIKERDNKFICSIINPETGEKNRMGMGLYNK